MRRLRIPALLVAAVAFAVCAFGAQPQVTSFTLGSAPGQRTIESAQFSEAQVSVKAATGTPDGTVTVKVATPSGGDPVTVATYATPTTVKTYRGPVGAGLTVALTGNTTGTVQITVLLK